MSRLVPIGRVFAQMLAKRGECTNTVALDSRGQKKSKQQMEKTNQKKKEADLKNHKTEMRQVKASNSGLAVPPIQVETESLSCLDGVPQDVIDSSIAIIRKRSKLVTQQGTDDTAAWEVGFGTKERWENPVIGWSSSGDSLSNLVLKFKNQEDAVQFIKKRGFQYQIDKLDNPKTIKLRPYHENFWWSSRKRVSTK